MGVGVVVVEGKFDIVQVILLQILLQFARVWSFISAFHTTS